MTTLQPGIRWDSTKYELDDFDFNELAEMFSQLRAGCGSNFNSYFGLTKKFVMLTMTNYELDAQAKKFLSPELLAVHERFVYRMIQICDLEEAYMYSRFISYDHVCHCTHSSPLAPHPGFVEETSLQPVKTRSLDDILSGKEDSREKLFLPHVSTLNAMAILYSLAYGWKAPDRKFGELVANSVHTLLRDRIDAALHTRKVPLTNEIGIHAEYQCSSTDEGDVSRGQSTSSNILYASDFLKSFSNKSHFLGYESDKLLRFRCHANFYKRLKTAVPEEEWDVTLEKMILDATYKQHNAVHKDGQGSSNDPNKRDLEVTHGGAEAKGSKRSVSSESIPKAKRKCVEKSSSCVDKPETLTDGRAEDSESLTG